MQIDDCINNSEYSTCYFRQGRVAEVGAGLNMTKWQRLYSLFCVKTIQTAKRSFECLSPLWLH